MTRPVFRVAVEFISRAEKRTKGNGRGFQEGKRERAIKEYCHADSNDIYFVIARALINEGKKGAKRIDCVRVVRDSDDFRILEISKSLKSLKFNCQFLDATLSEITSAIIF